MFSFFKKLFFDKQDFINKIAAGSDGSIDDLCNRIISESLDRLRAMKEEGYNNIVREFDVVCDKFENINSFVSAKDKIPVEKLESFLQKAYAVYDMIFAAERLDRAGILGDRPAWMCHTYVGRAYVASACYSIDLNHIAIRLRSFINASWVKFHIPNWKSTYWKGIQHPNKLLGDGLEFIYILFE